MRERKVSVMDVRMEEQNPVSTSAMLILKILLERKEQRKMNKVFMSGRLTVYSAVKMQDARIKVADCTQQCYRYHATGSIYKFRTFVTPVPHLVTELPLRICLVLYSFSSLIIISGLFLWNRLWEVL